MRGLSLYNYLEGKLNRLKTVEKGCKSILSKFLVYIKKEKISCTLDANTNFRILISLQSDILDLRSFKDDFIIFYFKKGHDY